MSTPSDKGGRVSRDDADLFRRKVGDVRRLEDDRLPPPRTRRRQASAPTSAASAHGTDQGLPESSWNASGDPGARLEFFRAGLQRKVTRQLRRGEYRIEDEIDLHGLTVPEARKAMAGFLGACSARGLRCVRVIHGKGTGSAERHGAIKAHVDRWLRERPEVLAFTSAQPRDGGTGAVYVLLKL